MEQKVYKARFRDRASYKLLIIGILAALCAVGFLVGNGNGTMQISPSRILEVIFHNDGSPQWMVIWNIRLPRVILAALVGINLALS